MIAWIVAEGWFEALAVFGLFPANYVDDAIAFYADKSRTTPLMSWHGLRPQHGNGK